MVGLVGERMRFKGGKSLWTPEMLANTFALAQECGQIIAMWLDGKLIGGTLCFLHQNEAYLWAIAHSPAHNRSDVGNVCLWKTIVRHIEMGIARHHFGPGEAAYKYRFGGRLEPLESVTVFSSVPVALWWHAGASARRLLRSMRRAPRLGARLLLCCAPKAVTVQIKESRLGRTLGRLFQ
jgi:CelD/BcsL family acetyltransferase involved in cellulose biosynthesis